MVFCGDDYNLHAASSNAFTETDLSMGPSNLHLSDLKATGKRGTIVWSVLPRVHDTFACKPCVFFP